MLVTLLIDKQFAALEANTTENLHQEFEELGIVHGSREHEMSKVTWATVIVLTARAADLTVLQNTHTGVKETVELPLGGRRIRNFAYGTS